MIFFAKKNNIVFFYELNLMNGLELLRCVRSTNLVDILNSERFDDSKKGNLYEKIWDIVIKCGYMYELSNNYHYKGNINYCDIHKIDDVGKYITNLNVFSKGDGGSSDITLKNKKDDTWIFISSKYFVNDSNKSVKDYDVQDIISVANTNKSIYQKYKIILLVKDKLKVRELIIRARKTNKYICQNISGIYDMNDLDECYKNLQKDLKICKIKTFINNFCIEKEILNLRFHQKLIVDNIIKAFNDGEKCTLIGAKCRSGKTYCVGGIVDYYLKKTKKFNVLIITPAPTETISQFSTDLFFKYKNFHNVDTKLITNGDRLRNIIFSNTQNIIIVSKQLLDDYIDENICNNILNIELDLIFFDENHYHGTTNSSEKMIKSYSCENTKIIYMSATYSKPLNKWNIPEHCQFYWDIEDEMLCKKRNIDGLIKKHGQNVKNFVNKQNKENILKVYDNMPELCMLTTLFDEERYIQIMKNINSTSFGFSCSTLFSLNSDQTEFNYTNEVDKFLKYISGTNISDIVRDNNSVFDRIINISTKKGSRTKLNNNDFSTQLWYLPFGKNALINNVSNCLKKRMVLNKILCEFRIIIINSYVKLDKDIKKYIEQEEYNAKYNGKRGMIVLLGSKLTLAITLPYADIVFLLNDGKASDRISQIMYRSMSEKIDTEYNINSGNKKIAFVVDFNISRCLEILLNFNIYNDEFTKGNIKNKLKYIINNSLIHIDPDFFVLKENKTQLIERLTNIWKQNPVNSFHKLIENIKNIELVLPNKIQKEINTLLSMNKTSHIHLEKCYTDSVQSIQNGRTCTKNDDSESENESDNESDSDDENKSVQIKVSFTKDVLSSIIPFVCILTLKNDKYNLYKILRSIKNNEYMANIFNSQCFIWWKKSNIFELIYTIVKKYIIKTENFDLINNCIIQLKTTMNNYLDDPDKLLGYINFCLKPKESEKKEFGEVFTPMEIVFEMIDKLDFYYKRENDGDSIFENPNLKWFDPASGMGNFIIGVYLRLMEGLKNIFLDDDERKNHIIKNMLYMSEINEKNVYICKQIFGDECNIYCGDTLQLDTKEEWGIKKFEIIVQNPPYNSGGIRSHTGKQLGESNKTLWPDFIEYSMKHLCKNGYLVSINPLSWLKNSHSVHNLLLSKHIIWMRLWDNIKSLKVINGKIPISLFILQNFVNNEEYKTRIISEIQSKHIVTTSRIYLNPEYSIPIAFHSIFNKLINFIEENNLQLKYYTKCVKSTGPKTKLPEKYCIEDNYAVDTYTIKDGIMVKKMSIDHPHTQHKKLIIANKSSFKGMFIDDGKLGLVGTDKKYILGNNLELLQKFFNFKICNIISHFTKYRQDFLDNDAFTYIPDIRKLDIDDINESEFYKIINLTEEEIQQINCVK